MTRITVRDVLNALDHEVWVRVRTDGDEGTGDKDIVVWSADWIGDNGCPDDLPKYLDWEADYLSIEVHKDPERGRNVPMLVVPAWSRGLEEKYRLRYRGCLPGEKPMPDDPMVGKEVVWSLREILDEINRDHSGEWTDYDETDWKEGLREWTWYELIRKE